MAFIDEDEANDETKNEDPSESPDAVEDMPELQQEETSTESIHKKLAVSKPKVQVRKQMLNNPLTYNREEYEQRMFKADTLRKKYDLRNKDPKEINNIFLRAHVKQLKEKSISKEDD